MTSVERYNKIQMFEDLKQNINRENLHKAQLNNRYNEAEEGSQELEQSRNEPRKITEDDDDSLSGYEFEERQANYQKLIEDAVDKDGFQLVINRQFLTPQCGNKKL